MTDLKIPGAAAPRRLPGARVPVPRPSSDAPLTDPAPRVDETIPLGRLLRLAGLTPAQAAVLAADLLATVGEGTDPEAGSEGTAAGQVVIGEDGRVVLRPPAEAPDAEEPAARRPSGGDVGALLADVAGAVRSGAGGADPAVDPLRAELDRAVAELPLVGPTAVARRFGEATARVDRAAVRAELGVLVRAIGRRAVTDSGPGSTGTRAIGAPSGTQSRAAPGGRRTARRRVAGWLLSLLVLAVAVLLENSLLHEKVAADIGALLDAGRGGSTPSSAAPPPDGLPVVPPAPAAAGGVRGLDLRPLAGCVPGAPCTVRLQVRVVPATRPQSVTWSYRLVDRCTAAVVLAPGGTVSVPAGQDRVAVVGTIALPKASAVAVVAVTAVPATAAAAPVLVGTCRPPAG